MITADPRLSSLPPIARQLAEKAGFDAGERLVLHFAGQRVFVPKTIRPRSILWAKLGPLSAKELSELFGGEYIEVPTGVGLSTAKRARQIRHFLKVEGQKQSKNAVAAAFKVNRRTVQRHRERLRRDHDRQQGSLDFDGSPKRD